MSDCADQSFPLSSFSVVLAYFDATINLQSGGCWNCWLTTCAHSIGTYASNRKSYFLVCQL